MREIEETGVENGRSKSSSNNPFGSTLSISVSNPFGSTMSVENFGLSEQSEHKEGGLKKKKPSTMNYGAATGRGNDPVRQRYKDQSLMETKAGNFKENPFEEDSDENSGTGIKTKRLYNPISSQSPSAKETIEPNNETNAKTSSAKKSSGLWSPFGADDTGYGSAESNTR